MSLFAVTFKKNQPKKEIYLYIYIYLWNELLYFPFPHSPSCRAWRPAAHRMCTCSCGERLISSAWDKCLVSMATSCAHVNMPAVCRDKAWHYNMLICLPVFSPGIRHLCAGTEFVLKMPPVLKTVACYLPVGAALWKSGAVLELSCLIQSVGGSFSCWFRWSTSHLI